MKPSLLVSILVLPLLACASEATVAPSPAAPNAAVTPAPAAAEAMPTAGSATDAAPLPASAATAPAAAASLTVVPMKLVAPKLGHSAEIKADGTVVVDGKVAWKITDAALIELDHPDEPLLAVAGDGTVTGFMVEAKDQVHFDDKDNLVDRTGGLAISDDGTIALSDKDRADFGDMKLAGFAPSARRAASLVVTQVLMGVAMEKALTQMKANLKKHQH